MKPETQSGRTAGHALLPGWWSALLFGWCLPLAAAAQTPNPAAGPGAQELLHTPVGGTHIPQQKAPVQPKNPYEGDPRAVAQGEQLFKSMNCIGCHAPQGGGGMGPPLSDQAWIYGKEPAQIFLTIMQGRPNGMPAFGNALPESEIWKLVTYVRTLSSPPVPAAGKPNTAGKRTGKP